jgi:hypothetical protein
MSKSKFVQGLETLANPLNEKGAEVKAVGQGSQKRVYVMKNDNEKTAAEEKKEQKAETAKSAKPKAEKPKVPHVGVDFTMPTLQQVAEFVKDRAKAGAKTLTATQIREAFNVPGKIPMNTRMKQLERAGFGKFEKVGKSNTLTFDMGAIASGKAAIKEKQSKPKSKKKKEKAKGS